ncbi:choline/glycine/proline betaine transport protein [Microbacterium testaceum]|uniref:BCCT family transporter n=1 Tax=Microbacterium TaxID=33882 RepID=UPI001B71A2EB|nr:MULTISPECIES: BCCT family transporter [Microbacterium]MDQ1111497.1 choline/glycine/proline betaine transport protein [Microbacterium testaceum]MDR6097967.1 choline/glycine/proline betaine transport protein [Microbacterium sp. SORGH_AS_0454]
MTEAAPDTAVNIDPHLGSRHKTIRGWVFWPAAAIAGAFIAFAMLFPSAAEATFGAVQTFIVSAFNWYYVLIAAFFVVFALAMGFSRFGNIKLGQDDDEPEFSTMSWFSLLFAAGMGIGLVFYGVSEPLSHFADPRPGVEGTPNQLAQQAMSQTFLHWGVHAWSIYVVIGLALAYAFHRRRRPRTIRWALEPLLGARLVQGGWGNAVDVAALVGTLFGVATSLGLGVIQISAGLDYLNLVTPSVISQAVIVGVITAFVLFSVLSGVGKGMKWLSNINLVLAGLLMLYLLFAGPTEFLLRDVVQSIGNYIQNFVSLSFTTSAYSGEDGVAWQGTWTAFYWGWWISWAPFVGIFIARISRGRTVREFVTGVILVPTLVGILWFTVLGGTAIYGELTGTVQLVGADGAVNVSTALFQMLQGVPGTVFLSIGFLILIGIFFVTSADSGALVMGMIATGGEEEPKRWVRIFFTLATSLIAFALLLAGGLQALQTAAISIALPFSLVLLAICWATVTAFRREMRAYDKAERAQLRDSIGAHYGLEVEEPNQRGIFGIPIRWRQPRVPVPAPAEQTPETASSDSPKA